MKLKKILLYLLLAIFTLSLSACEFSQLGAEKRTSKEKIVFNVYRPNRTGEWLDAEKHEQEISKTQEPLQVALQVLIEQPARDLDLVNIFPKGTKLLSVRTKGSTAIVNLSKEVRNDEIGGSLVELLLVNSIVSTATDFHEIKEVQFLVEGESIESLNGHLDLRGPLKRDESLIKKY